MNQTRRDRRFAEAVWDTTPIIRMFCAELDGRCACLTSVSEHVYPKKVGEELQRRVRENILGNLDRYGNPIKDLEYAAATLNAMRGSMIFHVREHPDIDIHSVGNRYSLNKTKGEFWVIEYAISKANDDIVVVIDEGPALNAIYRERKNSPQQRFTVWTSLHIIFRLMTKDKVLTYQRGSQLFVQLHDKFFRRLDEEAQRELQPMRDQIDSPKFSKRPCITVEKARPLYRYDANGKPEWVWIKSG